MSANQGGCYNNSTAFHLDAAGDAGTTYQYYQSDGVGSAILTQTGGLYDAFCIDNVANVTVNGLTFANWYRSAAAIVGGAAGPTLNALIENNVVYGTTFNNTSMGAISVQCARGNKITHNYVYNAAGPSITTALGNCQPAGPPGNPDLISGTVISWNVTGASCTTTNGDCGAIYLQDQWTPPYVANGYVTINNNYSLSPNAGSFSIYLDDGMSGANVYGNVMMAGHTYDPACAMIHGGGNNHYYNNICDMLQILTNNGNTTSQLVQQGTTANGYNWTMTGNQFRNNIITCNDGANCGGGYNNKGLPNGAAITNNAYFNHGSGGSVNGQGAGSGGVYENPQYQTCPTNGANSWSFLMTAGSPVFGGNVSFPAQGNNDRGIAWGQPGFWGPPGFVVPHNGDKPSYNPC
jgi:hypothetical protein